MSSPTILLTGGTGSFGTAMTIFLLAHTTATIRIYSRSELLQSEMAARFNNPRLRFLLGDIRDFPRLRLAMEGAQLVIHAAALKRIEQGEYNPSEFVATNVTGTHNVINACIQAGVGRAVFLSSDKAVYPLNLYGASKNVAEKLWIRSNGYAPHGTQFVAVRYGNVSGSRGSVIPLWRQLLANGKPLTITDLAMTRFYISLPETVELAWFTLHYAPAGSLLIPHLPAYSMRDVAAALCEEAGIAACPFEHVGIRPGEKMHEQLLDETEARRAVRYSLDGVRPHYYCILPIEPSWHVEPLSEWYHSKASYVQNDQGRQLAGTWEHAPLTQCYESGTWPYRLGVMDLQRRLAEE